MLIGTKSDMWRERQIAVDAGVQTCADYGCANFKEISTKESLDEVAEVFEAALRSGWLFREDGRRTAVGDEMAGEDSGYGSTTHCTLKNTAKYLCVKLHWIRHGHITLAY